jgi:hypothetical protein
MLKMNLSKPAADSLARQKPMRANSDHLFTGHLQFCFNSDVGANL